MSFPCLHFVAAAALAAALAAPAAAEDLRWLSPDAFAALPGGAGEGEMAHRPLMRHDDAVIAVRVSIPANTEVPPHPHPAGKVALVTVISGEIELGLGDDFDTGKLETVPAGSLVVFGVDDPQHFARTGPSGAELLLVAGPPEAIAPEILGAD